MSAELSVILVNKFGLDRLQRVFVSLERQSIASQLEVIVVSPFDPPTPKPSPFASLRYINFESMDSLGLPRAAGVHACAAPFLVFAEDHCFPEPGWADALLNRLREGWTGVGPSISNHNPSTWISRTDWLLNYGCFSTDTSDKSVVNIPPHNSAYSTAALQALGPELPALLQMDHHLQSRLLAQGGRFCMEPSARAAHANMSRPLAHWGSLFHGNRVYGATRAEFHRWPAHRRAIYAAAFPLIAALRLNRACELLHGWRALSLLPLLAIGATVGAAGESYGYLSGAGSSLLYRANEELDRISGVIARERRLLQP